MTNDTVLISGFYFQCIRCRPIADFHSHRSVDYVICHGIVLLKSFHNGIVHFVYTVRQSCFLGIVPIHNNLCALVSISHRININSDIEIFLTGTVAGKFQHTGIIRIRTIQPRFINRCQYNCFLFIKLIIFRGAGWSVCTWNVPHLEQMTHYAILISFFDCHVVIGFQRSVFILIYLNNHITVYRIIRHRIILFKSFPDTVGNCVNAGLRGRNDRFLFLG